MAARLLLSCALVLTLACADDAAGPNAQTLRAQIDEAHRAALASGDWNATLSLTKRFEALHPEHIDAPLLLARAQAELALDQQKACLASVHRAENLQPDADIAADLNTVAGMALLHRARELGDDGAWNEAGARLLSGVDRGALRAEAAYSLVLLQDLGGRSNPSRQRGFAKTFFELEPDSARGKKLRAYLEKQGVLP
jgi:hypothetical protein